MPSRLGTVPSMQSIIDTTDTLSYLHRSLANLQQSLKKLYQ